MAALHTRGEARSKNPAGPETPVLDGFIRILTSAQLPGYTVLYGLVDQRTLLRERVLKQDCRLGGRVMVLVWCSFLPVYKELACLVHWSVGCLSL